MRYSSIPLAQTVVQHLEANHIDRIVISPGSRSAPLTISFTENPFFKCYSIVDERSAAFFALGMAQQLQAPVALVCTSGSAVLNYYPAVAEAFYSHIPLVVISADRPPYKIDVGDGQTIRQDNVFHRHIGYSANLLMDLTHAMQRVRRYRPNWFVDGSVEALQKKRQQTNDQLLQQALETAIEQGLPVHINAPFEEPLYDFLTAPSIKANTNRQHRKEKTVVLGQDWAAQWQKAKKKMVLVGVNPPGSVQQEQLEMLANDPSVVVFTETTSNLHHPHFFNAIDTMIAPMELSSRKQESFKALQPEILLTFGGLIVSKKIKAFLREHQPKAHWHVGGPTANDTFFCLKAHVHGTPNEFLKKLYGGHTNTTGNYQHDLALLKKKYRERRAAYLKQIPFSDFLAFHHILSAIPRDFMLQLANSSTVRYAQLYDLHPSIKVFCNRGTSGIDGSTSTAVGASQIAGHPTVLITGDLSFFYDNNGLWNNYLRNDFKIIVVNNGGGGIFRILPGMEETDNFATFFETKHELGASQLCKMFGLDYSKAENEKELQQKLPVFFKKRRGPRLLEVVTPRISNNKILTDYFHFIS
ncbi:2-succinyl-5-enolpyruvyl-6-hydroxy-3-cyclohexene-1-carboxylate synthase [Maribacter sp. 2307ULW6-5]|uniref:2-succinyl-5-enolpyruvyl-6-hydroxy-3- cyclohexene-1-carboxylate synthase n=1 Tax=Maribacter sp. 2307ULW6-5 TaxID=3386275 RepID=UPI0039BD31CF